jgi:hypothetical protein
MKTETLALVLVAIYLISKQNAAPAAAAPKK